jgi:hypothetical protein
MSLSLKRGIKDFLIIIIPHCCSTGLPYALHERRTGQSKLITWAQCGLVGANDCKYSLPNHGGARDNKFLVTNPMTDQCCSGSAIVRAHVYVTHKENESKLNTWAQCGLVGANDYNCSWDQRINVPFEAWELEINFPSKLAVKLRRYSRNT